MAIIIALAASSILSNFATAGCAGIDESVAAGSIEMKLRGHAQLC
jgi:hypothetical protein